MKILLFISVFLLCFSCKNNKDTKTETKKPITQKKAEIDLITFQDNEIDNEPIGFDTLDILPDTLINNIYFKFQQISSGDYENLSFKKLTTDFEQDDPTEYLQILDSCYVVNFTTGITDTLCNFDDGEEYEKYEFQGFSNSTKTILFDWQNWEEAHSIIINVNKEIMILLNPNVEISPENNQVLTYSNHIEDPLYEKNEFLIFGLTEDSVRTDFNYPLSDYGVFEACWIDRDKVLMHIRHIDYDLFEAKDSYYYLMEMKNAL